MKTPDERRVPPTGSRRRRIRMPRIPEPDGGYGSTSMVRCVPGSARGSAEQ